MKSHDRRFVLIRCERSCKVQVVRGGIPGAVQRVGLFSARLRRRTLVLHRSYAFTGTAGTSKTGCKASITAATSFRIGPGYGWELPHQTLIRRTTSHMRRSYHSLERGWMVHQQIIDRVREQRTGLLIRLTDDKAKVHSTCSPRSTSSSRESRDLSSNRPFGLAS